jgi:thiol-disulfide isomerase/thioredoxin
MINLLLRLLLGAAFIFSGAVKLVPAEYLENDILRAGIGNDFTVPFLARFIVGSELFLGLMLLSGFYRRRILQLCMASLIVYSIYLIYVIVRFGNEGNCGCFGHQFELTPLEGIVKNVVMGVITAVLYKAAVNEKFTRLKRWVLALTGLISLGSPYIIYKVDLPRTTMVNGSLQEMVDFSPLYKDLESTLPSFDIRQGKALVMFGSLSCEHCRIAANKLELLKSANPDWNIFIIYNGKTELIPDFHRDAQIKNTPCYLFNDGESLARMVGVGLPVILLIENSAIVSKLSYPELREENFKSFFGN